MRFFLDSANLGEIREAAELGLIDGVTTNPTLIAKEGGVDFKRHIAAVCEMVAGDVSAEVTSLDTEGMLREGREYARIAPNVVIKCPLTRDGLKATRQLTSEGIKVNVTLCFSAAQAILAAKAGAAYVSPFVGRLDDIGQNGLAVLTEIIEIYRNYEWRTQVLASSIRHPVHVIEAARLAARAVVVGASFIGMEAAASLAGRGLAVTVVAPGEVPFEKTLGAEIGGLLRRVHEARGVRFKLGEGAARFEGDGAVEAVVLDSGERVEADLVVVGVGVRPATDFLEGVRLHEDGGVFVDRHLRAADGVYAAGDIAYFPSPLTGERQRIEHWRTAQQQVRAAARNMAGKDVEFGGVPFFWTRQFDAGLLYVGHAASWGEIIFKGAVPSQDFLAFYVKDERVLAVAGMNRDREMAAIEELMRLGRMPSPARLRDGPVDFLELLSDDGAVDSLGRGTAVFTV